MKDRDKRKREIERLPKAQRKAFDQICCGDDSGLHPRTLKALLDKDMIRAIEQRLPGLPPLTITRYEFTLPYHIAWCELMSDKYEEKG